MLSIPGDRRQHPRISISQPCKIHDPLTGKYLAGNTRDVSSGGVMIELPRLVNLKPGDTLHIGVALKRRQALIRTAEMLKASVRRTVHTVHDHTLLGLEFEEAQQATNAPPMRLAA